MVRSFLHILALVAAVALPWCSASAQPAATIEERLIRLEEGQKTLGERLGGRIDDTNRRIVDLRSDMGRRFDDLQGQQQTMIWILVVVLGALTTQGGLMWRRIVKVDTRLSDHLRMGEKDQQIVQLREEVRQGMGEIRTRVDRLEVRR